MSYSPVTGLVYFPAQATDWVYSHASTYVHHEMAWNLAQSPTAIRPPGSDDIPFRGYLVAWDPVRQKAAWQIEQRYPWNGGVLSTAGNLVIEGLADGRFVIYRADTGEQLWEMPIQTGAEAGPISYRVDGEQYIAVAAGWSGSIAIARWKDVPAYRAPTRILAFKLGGKQVLPPTPDDGSARTPPPAMTITDEASLKRGEHLFTERCAACHGRDVVGGGTVPDLRRPVMPFEDFKRVVLDGALKDGGMVGFRDVLDEQDTEKVYGYILQQAHADYDEHEKLKNGGFFVRLKIWWYDKLSSVMAWLVKK